MFSETNCVILITSENFSIFPLWMLPGLREETSLVGFSSSWETPGKFTTSAGCSRTVKTLPIKACTQQLIADV